MNDYQVMPPLSGEEYEALKADIAEHGVLVAVVKDQHGNILDGHHRVRIAAELGIGYPSEVREVADGGAARDVALALNLARRHLTREQRRELIAAEIRAPPRRFRPRNRAAPVLRPQDGRRCPPRTRGWGNSPP